MASIVMRMSVALLPLTTSNCCIGMIECWPVSLPQPLRLALRPIAVGAADVDRAELAEHQQHLVEMVGRSVIGVDQQGDIGFVLRLFDRAFRVPFVLSSAASRNGHRLARADVGT